MPSRKRKCVQAVSPRSTRSSGRRETRDIGTNTEPQRSQFNCAICKIDCLQNNPVLAFCGHMFCNTCLGDEARRCPICREHILGCTIPIWL